MRTAEIILFGAGGDVPLRTSLDTGGVTQTMQPVSHELATALRACLRDEHATVVTCASAPPALAEYLEEHRIAEAAIAPVPGETRLVGVMMLGERLGATTDFSRSDLRLFETLAGHAGMSLEFDRLEQAIRRMRELQGALERQAYRDPLTDLANRALFMRRVHESLARRAGTSTVLFLDLDDFKRINDHAGHAAGDAVLMAAAERIRGCVRPTDLAARLGGDEFAVLLEDADERHGAEVAHRIVALLSEAVTVNGQPCWVRASIGIASAGAGAGMDADDLMRHADIAMYRAKEAGKGQVRAFTPDMHPNALTKAPSRDEILAALDAERVRRPLPADRRRRLRRGRRRRGARALEPPSPRAAGAVRVRPGRRGDGHDPRHRPRRARAGVPRGRRLDRRRTATRATRPCT